jgi:hypothetical protein
MSVYNRVCVWCVLYINLKKKWQAWCIHVKECTAFIRAHTHTPISRLDTRNPSTCFPEPLTGFDPKTVAVLADWNVIEISGGYGGRVFRALPKKHDMPPVAVKLRHRAASAGCGGGRIPFVNGKLT